ncbi:PadR family transcriptional regulator [Kitasatospora sp. NPDC088548]|uniref:PadR family transcriptional regulator n=1 Tax=Kitasatospora sp. NPDC088548 TaxID=3364075 RepID=UPI00380CD8DF
MKFDHVLLGLLALHPRSGWDLRHWLASEGRFVRSNVHQSQIYRLLNRMNEKGWVEFEVDPRDGRPDAKVYRLTEAGRAELLAEARSPYRPTSRFQDPDFMTRFFFAGMLAPDVLPGLIDTELAYRRHQVATSRGRDRGIAFPEGTPEADAYRIRLIRELSHQYGTSAVDAWIDWLERTRRLLQDAQNAQGAAGTPLNPVRTSAAPPPTEGDDTR